MHTLLPSYNKERAYIPTPEEIAEGCREIQRGWTSEEFIRRARWAFCPAALARSRFRPNRIGRKSGGSSYGAYGSKEDL